MCLLMFKLTAIVVLEVVDTNRRKMQKRNRDKRNLIKFRKKDKRSKGKEKEKVGKVRLRKLAKSECTWMWMKLIRLFMIYVDTIIIHLSY